MTILVMILLTYICMLFYSFGNKDVSFWAHIMPITILTLICVILERRKELQIIVFEVALAVIGFRAGMFLVGMLSLLVILAVVLFHKFSIDRW